jgi:hypothetical protein
MICTAPPCSISCFHAKAASKKKKEKKKRKRTQALILKKFHLMNTINSMKELHLMNTINVIKNSNNSCRKGIIYVTKRFNLS